MKPLWICDSCKACIYPFSRYVVLQLSWRTDRNDHLCGVCFDAIMEGAALGHAVMGFAVQELANDYTAAS